MPVNHEVKGQLAKLLATENLIIEHKKVSTASFDVLRRVLTLPVWNAASNAVYDLLVGHEVGHALYTPNEDWTLKVSPNVPKDYINVVEDARIEKLMKRKFPGLARTFYTGYKELNTDDFFGIANEDVSKLTLIDRINLHFKIGAYAQMPFNDEEQTFVCMIEVAETFDQVLDICEQIAEYVKEKATQQIEISATAQVNSSSGGQGEEGESQQFSNGESDDEMDGNTQGSVKKSEEGGDQQDNSSEEGKLGGGPNESDIDESVSKTQQNFDDQAQKLTSNYGQETYYVQRPEIIIDRVIVPCNVLTNYVDNSFSKSNSPEVFQPFGSAYHKYRKESQKEVNYLVKEFEMKKSADAYQRMTTARTGVLDTKMLHTYKHNDDIFRKVSVIPDGKNHGLIFILDWSGSMTDHLLDTIKQLFNLIWFCKKVQIPFEVYGFTYEWSPTYLDSTSYHKELYKKFDGSIVVAKQFALLNFVSSKVNNKVFERAMINLWRLATKYDRKSSYSYNSGFTTPYGLDLSGTPLNESIICLHQIIPDFKNKNKLQKVNVVILTDGEANHIPYDVDLKNKYNSQVSRMGTNSIGTNNALRDPKIGYVYRNFNPGNHKDGITSILLENVKDNFPEVNLIGFRILDGNSFSYLYRDYYKEMDSKITDPETVMSIWRKEKTFEINGMGYDAVYMISSSNLSSSTATMKIGNDPSSTDIGKAFRTMLKKKSTNKKLLSSFASLVS